MLQQIKLFHPSKNMQHVSNKYKLFSKLFVMHSYDRPVFKTCSVPGNALFAQILPLIANFLVDNNIYWLIGILIQKTQMVSDQSSIFDFKRVADYYDCSDSRQFLVVLTPYGFVMSWHNTEACCLTQNHADSRCFNAAQKRDAPTPNR